MSGKRKRPPFESPVTDRKYARCLETGGHQYSAPDTGEVVSRHFQGHLVQLRVCRKCGVPEKPKIRTATK